MPRPAGRKVRQHEDASTLAVLYVEVDPSVKSFFTQVAGALNITQAAAVEEVVRHLRAHEGDGLPPWVLRRAEEEQFPAVVEHAVGQGRRAA
jgi:hypothetical protein